jgi:hypothetical protein
MVCFNSWDKIVALWLAVLVFAVNWNMSGRVTHLLQKQKKEKKKRKKLVSESTLKRGSFTIGTTKHPATSSLLFNT